LDIALRRRLAHTGTDGAPADPALAARAWSLFRELLRYLDARSCRHDFVLRYFGDEHELLGGCGHCDVCEALDGASPQEEGAVDEETTRIVRVALSAVARAQRRAGLGAVGEMLRGLDSERTRRFGFTALSTFGLLRDRSESFVVGLLRSLLAAGWIDLTPSEHPVPLLTRAGVEVMKGVAPARILLPTERRPAARARRSRERAREPASLDPSARALFEKLRAHRAEVARERGVPAYVVAHDRTLEHMAALRPRDAGALRSIFGMGPSRVEQYGEGFLRVILEA
jgi:ATP-dependent DNA helicase RecQ